MKKICDSVPDCVEENVPVTSKNGHNILECRACSHRFVSISGDHETHLKDVYSDDYFFEGKAGYPNYLENREILINHGARYAKIMSRFINRPGTMLDVGCSAGFILKGFEQAGWTCDGIEPNKTMVDYSLKEFGFNIQVGSLESFKSDKKFDLITLIQVIGHFHDIDSAIRNAHHLLKSDGYVLVESWNRDSMVAKLFGNNWHEYSPPSVVNWFSEETLRDLFNFYGFTFVSKGLPLKRINIKHAFSLIAGDLSRSRLKQKAFNIIENTVGRLPVIYPPFDLGWYVFKKR